MVLYWSVLSVLRGMPQYLPFERRRLRVLGCTDCLWMNWEDPTTGLELSVSGLEEVL